MQAQEVMDRTVEVLEYAPALGVQVKTMVVSLALPLAGALAWKVVKWPFKKHAEARAARTRQALLELNDALARVVEEQVPEEAPKRSPACEVILRSLDDANPSYNFTTHRLFCPGVAVEFMSNEGRAVARIVGSPRFEGDKMLGTEVCHLLSSEELGEVCRRAFDVRHETVRRDTKIANERAAAEITGAHYREKARQQAALLNQNGHQPVVYDTKAQSSMAWLNEPMLDVPQNSARR